MEQIAKFAQARAQLNIPKSCYSSLRSAFRGIRRWAPFGDFSGRQLFPPTERGMAAWSGFFGARSSFEIYVAPLEMACLLLGVSAARKSKAVIAAGHGLAEAGDRLSAPRPAISEDRLARGGYVHRMA